MEQSQLDNLAAGIQTNEDLFEVLEDLREVSERIYKKGSLSAESLRGEVSQGFLRFMQALEKDESLPSDPGSQEAFFRSIRQYLERLPTVRVMLAFSPHREFLGKIASYFANEGQKPILDLLVKEEIGGGIIFEHSGKYRDLSIAGRIVETTEDKDFLASLLKKQP